MDILFLLIPISLIFVFVIGWALWWAIFNGQFDDAQREGERILEDDDRTAPLADVSEKQQKERSDSTH